MKWLKSTANLTVIEGHARFFGDYVISVNGMTLEAPQIFIKFGARALVPALPGLPEIDYLTSSSIMDLDTLPAHLLIIGGSYIGLEFAQTYRRFGSKVTVVEAHSHTPLTTAMKSLRPIYSMVKRDGSATGFRPTRFSPIRRWGASACASAKPGLLAERY